MPADNRVQAHPGRYLDALRADVRAGLTATPKTLPPKYFYDARGSELFDEITRLPEYYLTRAETSILQRHAARDRRAVAVRVAGRARQRDLGQDPAAAARAARRRDAARVRAVRRRPGRAHRGQRRARRRIPRAADRAVRRRLRAGPRRRSRPRGRRTIAFIGSTIGNLEPAARAGFLAQVGAALRPGDTFLLGHRPGQGHRPAAARLRRRGRGHRGVQPQRPAWWSTGSCDADFAVEEFQHVARVGCRERVDRDAAAAGARRSRSRSAISA